MMMMMTFIDKTEFRNTNDQIGEINPKILAQNL